MCLSYAITDTFCEEPLNNQISDRTYTKNGVEHSTYYPAKEWYWVDERPEHAGWIMIQRWCNNGVSHRASDKPSHILYHENGKVSEKVYYLNGVIGRIDAPAILKYHENGKVSEEVYYLNGIIGRIDAPAILKYHENGKVSEEVYYLNGVIGRIDGPAIIRYHEHGIICREYWLIDGEYHREGHPAVWDYWSNQDFSRTMYYKHGKLHNLTGPAVKIKYHDIGKTETSFYIMGIKVTHIDDVIEWASIVGIADIDNMSEAEETLVKMTWGK